ncbi:MAG: transcriptional repressor [Clostridia bacterium]|nr:transcriptional repressor [Clostridia bacterium]
MLKKTKTRELIKNLLKNSSSPLSAQDIFNLLKDQNITLSSIYRTLDTFYKNNIVSKESSHDNTIVYSISGDNHKHYLECKICHKTIDLGFCPYHKVNEQIFKKHKFLVNEHNVIIYGICDNCNTTTTK